MRISVIVPKHEDRYRKAKKSKKTGKPTYWIVNGQGLYNATLHYRLRGAITKYFHKYLSRYIKDQITEEDVRALELAFKNHMVIGVSVDIYEVKRGKMPDIRNMWLWGKWFEDALQECGVIPDDNPNYVIESGPTRYRWVDNVDERKLVFHIYLLV